MTCEDNALAAFQEVSSATQSDINHYINDCGFYEKDWIDRDMRTSIVRLAVTAEASLRAWNKTQDRIFEKNKEIQNLEAVKKYYQDEAAKNKALADMSAQDLMKAEHNEEIAKQELEKELEEEKQKGKGVDLAAVNDTFLTDWVNEWHLTPEGKEWLAASCRGAQLQGYQAAVRRLEPYIPPDMSKDDRWSGMPKFDNVGIDDEGNVFFMEQDMTEAEVDPSEIERLLAVPDTDTNAAALDAQEQSLKEAL
ncbi:hypothetical protein Dimus_001312 [Dionaea muscipula]